MSYYDEFTSQVQQTQQTTSESTSTTLGFVPKKDLTFATVITNIKNAYQSSDYELAWMSRDGFATLVDQYIDNLSTVGKSKTSRSGASVELRQVNAEINQNLRHVKYLIEVHAGSLRLAREMFASYAIKQEKSKGEYKLPTNMEERLVAMQTMIDSMTANNIDSPQYGPAYWAQKLQQLKDLSAEQFENVSIGTLNVGDKNLLKDQISKVLNALINLNKANYPDTWKNVIRNWGFLRENYR